VINLNMPVDKDFVNRFTEQDEIYADQVRALQEEPASLGVRFRPEVVSVKAVALPVNDPVRCTRSGEIGPGDCL